MYKLKDKYDYSVLPWLPASDSEQIQYHVTETTQTCIFVRRDCIMLAITWCWRSNSSMTSVSCFAAEIVFSDWKLLPFCTFNKHQKHCKKGSNLNSMKNHWHKDWQFQKTTSWREWCGSALLHHANYPFNHNDKRGETVTREANKKLNHGKLSAYWDKRVDIQPKCSASATTAWHCIERTWLFLYNKWPLRLMQWLLHNNNRLFHESWFFFSPRLLLSFPLAEESFCGPNFNTSCQQNITQPRNISIGPILEVDHVMITYSNPLLIEN